ncbi:sulfurtransferase complex subunit TusB [Enterobacter roggenkampii]|uniref:sulfurtransferase complex subunit TusB n=1 Tax=Enterobacter roggenkampii TaxID=1812935 RepID=UPI000F4DFCC7|nr:sulfurtransferase complex subunit TusB [Enterobacter roggenkampii]AYY06763.1 sulfurtransferase complex subunit TusB [Enterobacter roggenkampii]QMR82525.1 sulfurtransferase complex subunit TusB [Enterobacter roggenkampii]HDR2854292.1 sulfurtransferase complex subunit TusB [Enterobacter roggenkampii]HDR2858707.1 sulfurtransferase complex subunit TusB [Enterobacter roggenkampii]HDT2139761.1 sulfurtransferase complex subunit TusB [Enterobacter roggenkampii]
MLHTLSHSPWQCDIDALLSMLRDGDDLLLIQDGVLAALEGSRFVEMLTNAPITVSALKDDLDARGLSGRISAKIDVVGYTDFVNLTVTHASQMNW